MERNFRRWMAKKYSASPLAKGILNALPYGSALSEYLSGIAKQEAPNSVKCEMGISRVVEEIYRGKHKNLLAFELWGTESAIRGLMLRILRWHSEYDYSNSYPQDLEYNHGDETGSEKLTYEQRSAIYVIFLRRGLLWQDPHNDKIMLTNYGKEMLCYLEQ